MKQAKKREYMIVRLVENDIEVMLDDIDYMRDQLRAGCGGYDKMTDEDIEYHYDMLFNGLQEEEV